MSSTATLDFVSRYLSRLDRHLATLPRSERLSCLKREREKWLAHEQAFIDRVDNDQPPEWGETAVDYALTIAALTALIAEEPK